MDMTEVTINLTPEEVGQLRDRSLSNTLLTKLFDALPKPRPEIRKGQVWVEDDGVSEVFRLITGAVDNKVSYRTTTSHMRMVHVCTLADVHHYIERDGWELVYDTEGGQR